MFVFPLTDENVYEDLPKLCLNARQRFFSPFSCFSFSFLKLHYLIRETILKLQPIGGKLKVTSKSMDSADEFAQSKQATAPRSQTVTTLQVFPFLTESPLPQKHSLVAQPNKSMCSFLIATHGGNQIEIYKYIYIYMYTTCLFSLWNQFTDLCKI